MRLKRKTKVSADPEGRVTLPSLVTYEWRGGARSVCPCRLVATRVTHRVFCKDGACVVVPAPGRFGCIMRLSWREEE
jgi:hypothetical protein